MFFPCLGCCSLGWVQVFERSRVVAPRKGKCAAGSSSWTTQWTRQRGQDAAVCCALRETERCSREVQGAGTQISFSSKGKNLFLRSQNRLRKVFWQVSEICVRWQDRRIVFLSRKGMLSQWIFCFSPFFEVLNSPSS